MRSSFFFVCGIAGGANKIAVIGSIRRFLDQRSLGEKSRASTLREVLLSTTNSSKWMNVNMNMVFYLYILRSISSIYLGTSVRPTWR